jgi:protein SCO1/2
MCSKKWLTSLALAFVCQVALATIASAQELSTKEIAGNGGDFTLQSFSGPVSLEQYRGNVVLLFFGYTSCPDICPIALSVMSNVFSKIEVQELERVKALFVSLDPDRDTPELLRKYTGYFHPNIIGVTDRIEVINRITKNYGVTYEKIEMPSSPIGYVINHTLDILVVNQKGQLLDARIKPATSTEDIVAYVRRLLSEDQ